MKIAHPPAWQHLLFLKESGEKEIELHGPKGSKHLGSIMLVKDPSSISLDDSGMKCNGHLG